MDQWLAFSPDSKQLASASRDHINEDLRHGALDEALQRWSIRP